MAVDPQVQTILDKLRERGAREYWQIAVCAILAGNAGIGARCWPIIRHDHPFFSMGGAVDAVRAAHREATQALRRAFGTEAP